MEHLRQAAAAIKAADALLITAGAGMGVDSGLPDFRGNQGFWRAYPAIAKLGLSFSAMANPDWFSVNPRLAWAFYGHRLNLYRATRPHVGFNQLLALGQAKAHGYFVYTSNVDGQFQRAGFAADRLVECHGSIHHFQCSVACSDAIWAADETTMTIDEETFLAQEPLPQCRHCSALARPNILMFNDWQWHPTRSDSQLQQFSVWQDQLIKSSAKLAVIELGAGNAIPTVRHAGEQLRRKTGGTLIRINPREWDVRPGQISLPCGAAEGIRKLLDCM